jgi:predicted esterase
MHKAFSPAMVLIAPFVWMSAAFAADVPMVSGTPLERHEIKDGSGRTITYYLSRPKQSPAPLLLMIQGSGCMPVINVQPNGAYSTLFNLFPFANEGQFAVMAVEKPYAGMSGRDGNGGAACREEFNKDFSADTWSRALEASLADARKAPWVDNKRTLIIGFSEGAVMAAVLAGGDSRITDVISIGGSGTTQLYDFVVSAYEQCFDVSQCLSEIDSQLRSVRANPSSSTQFAWGHTYKRWSSFLSIDPTQELLKSKARIYIAFGTNDRSTPPLSQEIAVAKLNVAGRDVTVRRVANADHSLMQPNNPNFESLDKELRAALAWFWQR